MGMMDRVVEWNRLESRPFVKELTDTERLDFLDEYGTGISVKERSELFPRIVSVICDDVVGKGRTWREAVDVAKAKFDEGNS